MWRFDVFPKFSDKEIRIKTTSGGIIGILMIFWIVYAFVFDIKKMIWPKCQTTVIMDNETITGPRKEYLNFDITISSPCTILHIDQFEDDGYTKTDIIENITRDRLVEDGTPIEVIMERRLKNPPKTNYTVDPNVCGSCYGAKSAGTCCNTCADVVKAFKQKGWSYFGADRWSQCVKEGIAVFKNEKCHIKGFLKVKRTAGKFHIGMGRNIDSSGREHRHDTSIVKPNHSLSHSISTFHFGKPINDEEYPLEKTELLIPNGNTPFSIVTYFLHIVPTKVQQTNGEFMESFTYTLMFNQKQMTNKSKKGLPGIHFFFDFSPMIVVKSYPKYTLRNLLIHIGGIIGGAFSFAAIIDALMYGAMSSIQRKQQIGKDI